MTDRAAKPKPNKLRFTGTFDLGTMTAKASGTLTFRTASEFRHELTRLYNETVKLGYLKDDLDA